eukprot:CAMPEP_0119411316 /NCGR_PEP_ID=MMETSP1335-20130426/4092_1 /TAXON_ID=259385 /ORGANISM="Chrysoculter rhomboideus, Strain RCC1486" /LENGTH=47 /DNA_ID= /DNA_START= /DNA_END= /DNA_ORIENTATION=
MPRRSRPQRRALQADVSSSPLPCALALALVAASSHRVLTQNLLSGEA